MNNNCNNCNKEKNKQNNSCNNNCVIQQCGKLDVFDWLSNFISPNNKECDFVEIRFKNDRKDFYKKNNFNIKSGDWVIVEALNGYDIGIITLKGELVRIQMRNKKKFYKSENNIKLIYRIASENDLHKLKIYREKEPYILEESKKLIKKLNILMKLSDVEYQGDGGKITFYYTAQDRIDFRELIKILAKKFSTRIEMRQIGYRQEASKIGGIGSCGRELCCSTWLTDFKSVNTSSARYQQLSISTEKLTGQCGKLKCCINYELDSYLDAIKYFPDSNSKLYTEKGIAECTKIDVFRKKMWFAYNKNSMNWYSLNIDEVKKIIYYNKQGKIVKPLEDFCKKNQFNKIKMNNQYNF